MDVDVIGIGEQQVSGGTGLEPIPGLARGPEPATQPGHLGLQGVRRTARRPLAVQVLDQAIGRHHPAGVGEQ